MVRTGRSSRTNNSHWLILAVGVLVCPPWAAVEAQQIEGELVAQGSGRPVAYAFVVLRDSTGAERGRARTDALGRFALQAPEAGTYRLQTAIIGVKSQTSRPFVLGADEILPYRMEVVLLPIRLSAVVVTGEARCRVTPDAGAAVAQVWEEARKALSAVSWSQRSDSLQYQIIHYTRRLNPGSLKPVGGRATRASGTTAGSPFASAPAAELSATGYIRRNADGAWEHFGPDADVLLSETFANDHCFYLREHRDEAELVGLGFEPVRRRELPDVRGVLWLSKETARLRYVDFEYTRLPWPVPTRHVGGHVEFEQLPTGPWIVSHWWLRMPVLVRRDPIRRPTLLGFHETGGYVIQFQHDVAVASSAGAVAVSDVPDEPDTEWHASPDLMRPSPGPVLRGVAAELGAGGPVARATVLLLGPSDSVHAVTQSTPQGWFELTAPGPGLFRLQVSRWGYRGVSSEPLEVARGQMVDLRANLRYLVAPPDSAVPDTAPRRVVEPLAAFSQRRASGITLFSFNQSEIEERAAETLLALVATVHGARVTGPPEQRSVALNASSCPPAVYIDGHPAVTWQFLRTLPIEWVAAVEVFRNAVETPEAYLPPEEQTPDCGTVLVWTVGTGTRAYQ
ncbi:MAG: hypothetical protein GTN62_05870 [Gemmatimonadales bacterium]|nr:hypothetical protein [Gemmatimonadales bacterium]NIN11025.1 hypothetical protein [Gemmatimonadales bacterium]NIN49622.1 hypothetical protein [Gemmatimonadales bacterium]NIP07086.1 hypothetical protein [Gemmatimonadales bacterium]NIQ99477.1 hypothetical protein [Gemmatimonadales bacterium]